MCYNKDVSLATYIIGSVASLYLLITGDKYDKHIGLFALFYIQIQLFEYLIWIDQECKTTNSIATKLARINVCLQPLFILLGAILFKTTTLPMNLLYTVSLIIIVGTFISCKGYINNTLCTKPGKSGHLDWNNISVNPLIRLIGNFFYYTAFFLWVFMTSPKRYVIILATIFSFLWSIKEYDNFGYMPIKHESKWCFIAAGLPVALIMYKLVTKQ